MPATSTRSSRPARIRAIGTATLGIGAPAFYHKRTVEAGGATPDRLFSYYVGIGGYNQDFRYVDQLNGRRRRIAVRRASASELAPPNGGCQRSEFCELLGLL